MYRALCRDSVVLTAEDGVVWLHDGAGSRMTAEGCVPRSITGLSFDRCRVEYLRQA